MGSIIKPDIKVCLADVKLDNPIIPASGVFGYGMEYKDLYDLDILGAASIKGTTVKERYGNPQPRIAECSCGMLNAIGLQNPGIMHVREYELPQLREVFHKPIIANISGFAVSEYVTLAEELNDEEQVEILEVNISCPNVKDGGMSFGTDPNKTEEIVRAIRKVTVKPVFIKLTPNVTSIVDIAKACEAGGADGLCLINNLMGMKIDLKTRKPVLRNRTGGLSGPAVKPIAVRMVNEVFNAVNLPIIGVGGISSTEDVLEMIMAGAAAVEIGSANLINPWVCPEIIENLPIVMKKYGINSLREIIGIA